MVVCPVHAQYTLMGGSGDDDVRFAHEFAIYTTSSSYNTQSDGLPNSYQLLLDGGEGNDTDGQWIFRSTKGTVIGWSWQ